MRTTTCVLIGNLIQSVLVQNDGNYDEWLRQMIERNYMDDSVEAVEKCSQRLQLDALVDQLVRLVRSTNPKLTNNMCKRYALIGLRAFLPTLMRTAHVSYALEILMNVLHMRYSTYNLVKCELVDLLASIDYKCVVYGEQIMAANYK